MRPSTLLFALIFLILFFSVSSHPLFEEFWNIDNSTNDDEEFESRKKKKRRRGNKNHIHMIDLTHLLIGALLLKSVIFPLAVKAMAVMSGISVFLSTMSLVVSSIVAIVKATTKSDPVKVVHTVPYSTYSWSKDDNAKNLYSNVEGFEMLPPKSQ